MRRLVPLALLALVGCGYGEERTVDGDRLDRLLLQPADLAGRYRKVPVRSSGAHAPERVRYRRLSSRWKAHPREVESTVWAFDSSESADAHLDAARERDGWQPIDEPGLGEESFAATVVEAGNIRRYRVSWREHNVAATLEASGDEGRLSLADVLELALKQERRIADAGR